MLETDPSPFVRNFEQNVFKESLRQVNFKFDNFNKIKKIDLSGQVIGDEGCDKLCAAIMGSRILQINLSGNKITDKGMLRLSYVLRSLGFLKSLNLSWNDFTDEGISYISHEDHYAPALQEIDLTYNAITVDSAYHIGFLFSSNITSQLSILRLGGNLGASKYWGDPFVQVLMTCILNNNVSQLRELHVPDFNMTDNGVEAILSLLCCDKVNLDVLNISKNFIRQESTRVSLLASLRLCRKLIDFHAVDCGFSQKSLLSYKLQLMEDLPEKRMRWLPHTIKLVLSQKVMKAIYDARMIYLRMQKVMLNTRKTELPAEWKNFIVSYDNDLLSNLNAVMSNSAEFLNRMVRSHLVDLNREVAFVHKLQEVLATVKSKDIPKSAQKRAASADPNKKVVHVETDRLQNRILANQVEILATESISKRRFQLWDRSVDNLLSVCREVMIEIDNRVDRRRHRNARTLAPFQLEQIQFALEDCYSQTMHKGTCDQILIGLYCEQKLLRFCEVQRSIVNNRNKFREYEEQLYMSVPCCNTLNMFAFYSYYAFLQFPKEKDKLPQDLSHMEALIK